MWRTLRRRLARPFRLLSASGKRLRPLAGRAGNGIVRAVGEPGPRLTGWAVAVGIVLYALALWKAPDLLRGGVEPRDRHNARVLVVSVGGAVVVGIGLLYTARNYRLSHRGQNTERFTRALERLESDQMYVRMGGIYALRQLMADSPDHHDDTVQILNAYIRQHAPPARPAPADTWMHPVTGTTELDPRPAPDVQAAVAALVQRPDRPETHHFDLARLHLTGTNLENSVLTRANLEGAVLTGANLRGATLTGAHLGGAVLTRTELADAALTGADLRRAVLTGADLGGADLTRADLRRAVLTRANLGGAALGRAHLWEAALRYARLGDAVLTGARLRFADLAHADLQNAALTDADLRYTTLTRADLRGADLTRAELWYADLTGADLRGAGLTGAELVAATLTEADLSRAALADLHFEGATLTRANLEGTDLTGAHLGGANLTGARLQNADLTGADLQNARLTGADLTGADLTGVRVSAYTTGLPERSDAGAGGRTPRDARARNTEDKIDTDE